MENKTLTTSEYALNTLSVKYGRLQAENALLEAQIISSEQMLKAKEDEIKKLKAKLDELQSEEKPQKEGE